jgi:hypothetical protein
MRYHQPWQKQRSVIHLAKSASVTTWFHSNQAIHLPKPEPDYETDKTLFYLVLGDKTHMVADMNVTLLRK